MVNCNFKRQQKLTGASKSYCMVILYHQQIIRGIKEAMEDITGATVYNGGFSGHTVAQKCKAQQICKKRIFDYEPNVIVVLMGGNDTGAQGTVGTFNGSVVDETVVS